MTAASPPPRLPRRDFVILPLLSLLTVVVMLAASELVARFVFAENERGNCGLADPIHGYRFKADCVSYRKAAEGPEVEMTFNDCGYRTRQSCGPKPVGALRIALLGASTAEGLKVAYDQAFAGRLEEALSRRCGRPVEVQNMGVAGYKPLDQYLRVDEALAMHPDMVMLIMNPYELEETTDPQRLADRHNPDLLRQAPVANAPPPRQSPVQVIDRLLQSSRAVVAAQHFLYQDRQRYVGLFLLHGDKADYLRGPFTPRWERRLADLELLYGEMADKIAAANLPFVVVAGPQRIQAALLKAANLPAGVDPHLIGERLAQIADRHGIAFIDTLDDFASLPVPEAAFYPVDGHMTGEGHAIVANAVVRRLTADGIGPFAGCRSAAQVAR
jgi:hypothetical protein